LGTQNLSTKLSKSRRHFTILENMIFVNLKKLSVLGNV